MKNSLILEKIFNGFALVTLVSTIVEGGAGLLEHIVIDFANGKYNVASLMAIGALNTLVLLFLVLANVFDLKK